MPVVSAMAGDTQLGARFNNHGSTATGHLMARAYVDVAQVRKVSVALLFVDLRSAFASVVRTLAVPTGVSDDVWRQRLAKNGYSNEEVKQIFSLTSDALAIGVTVGAPSICCSSSASFMFTRGPLLKGWLASSSPSRARSPGLLLLMSCLSLRFCRP